ncbi:FecR family protein [Sphingomonas cavernae]|uniref:DUF4880 domain-containing protein n=1 Tax=Sphingomonas cavernae TaxID=2320861 RepID=A0A418WQL6_9SPHN|nr:FecR domain-containing protein [Sphingomonas cavernae]RJF93501.1 DUF4880 domain-containing protein [Sphingomonas cavernae]
MTVAETEQTRREAADWFARMQSDVRNDDDLERFNQWLAADPDNQRSYARLVARWDAAAPLAAGARERTRTRRRGLAGGALVIAALGAFTLSWQMMQPDYATRVGEQRRVSLADGSAVVLDTDSAIDVDLEPGTRRLALRKGRARFDVRADARRPFVVDAGDVRITALGTAFDVLHEGDRVDVVLIHGKVRVDRKRAKSVVLAPAQRAVSVPGRDVTLGATNLDAAAAWSEGRLVYAAMPLGEALHEIARYADRPLVIGAIDPDARVSGVFETKDPLAALRTIARYYDLEIIDTGSEIRISKKQG